MAESVDFCILSYNRFDDLKACLAAAEQARTSPEDRVIVVDNGSTDATCEYLRNYVLEHPFCTFIANTKNLGVAGGRNTAYRLSTADIIISLDDDSVPAPDIVTRTREAFRRFPEALVVAYRIVHPLTREVQNESGPQAVEVPNFHGAGYAVHRRAISTVGLLDEECRFGAEELDYSIRIRCAGRSVVCVPDIVVLHNSRLRAGKHAQNTAVLWCYNFSRIFFKYFPARIAFSLLVRSYAKELVFGWRHGLALWIRALKGLYDGTAAGLKNRTSLPPEILRFYISPSTRPHFLDIGKRPKLVKRLRTLLSSLLGRRRPAENSYVHAASAHVTFNEQGCQSGERGAGQHPSEPGNRVCTG